MRRLRFGLLLLVFAWLCGCATMRTDARYDDSVDLSSLKTFRFATKIDPPAVAAGAPGTYAPEANDRIRSLITSDLSARGIQRTESDDADMVVSFLVGTWAKDARTAMDSGINGELWIHFLQTSTDRVFFQGSAQTTFYSSMKPAEEVEKAVTAILAELPR